MSDELKSSNNSIKKHTRRNYEFQETLNINTPRFRIIHSVQGIERPISKRNLLKSPIARMIHKAKYVLHGQPILLTQQRGDEVPRFSREIRSFLKQLHQTHDPGIVKNCSQKSIAQLLIPSDVSFIVMRSSLIQTVIDMLSANDYKKIGNYLYEVKKTRKLDSSESIINAIVDYSAGDHLNALTSLRKLTPKNEVILYNIGLLELLYKQYDAAIKVSNEIMTSLIENKQLTLLKYAIHIRAIANFETQNFEFAFHDYVFYSNLIKNPASSYNRLIICQFPFKTFEKELNKVKVVFTEKQRPRVLL